MSEGLSVFPDTGFFIKGTLSGMVEKTSEYDGQRKISYKYLVVCGGIDAFLVSSEVDYRKNLKIGDPVLFNVFPMVFAQKVYYTRGVLVA